MRRWNGWGDEATDYPLPNSAARHLAALVGEGASLPDAAFEDVVASVPASRLAVHPGQTQGGQAQDPPLRITTDAAERVRHARGQSLPDWVALRSGRLGAFPDGVAYPASTEEVRALLDYARRAGVRLIPYGGGTSVVGHLTAQAGDRPVLTCTIRSRERSLRAGPSAPPHATDPRVHR